MVDVTPCAPASNSHSAGRGIDPRIFYRAEVDDQAIVANSQASRVVTATSDGQEQTIFSPKIHRVNDVRYVGTTGNEARLFVDHRVVHLPGFVVIFVTRFDQLSTKVRFEIGSGVFVKHNEVSAKRSHGQDA
jgi:hypothetical protein